MTQQIIVMGFPAVGVESIYRNHRADVQRFLSARHGSDFWVFNFCPLTENAYHESVFEGRVSRYPFPDHQSVPSLRASTILSIHSVPPFAYLPLITREIHAWLSGSDARVAVLHCKGTCLCLLLPFRVRRHWQYSRQREVRHPCLRVSALTLRFTFSLDVQRSS